MAEHPARAKVHAYVQHGGQIKEPRSEGWMVAGDIYAQAPDDVLYSVVEMSSGEFQVWEYDQARGMSYALARTPPEPAWRGPSVDAGVMWAVHHVR